MFEVGGEDWFIGLEGLRVSEVVGEPTGVVLFSLGSIEGAIVGTRIPSF